MNVYEFLMHDNRATPERVLLEVDSGASYTAADIDRETARISAWLRSAGARVGDRLAAQVDKSPHALFLYLGCMRAGVCFVPLNTAYQQAELAHMLADASPRFMVGRPESELSLKELLPDTASVFTLGPDGSGSLAEALPAGAAQHESIELGEDAIATIIYTSGTTGRAKGAMVTHGNLCSNAAALRECWRMTQDDVLLHALPMVHAHGLFVAVHPLLAAGARILLHQRFDPQQVLRDLRRVTIFSGVPTMFNRLLATGGLDRQTAAAVRLFISGSAPLSPGVLASFEELTGHRIVERYGLSEGGIVASNPSAGARKAGSVGRPLPGVSVRIDTGEIQVRGPNVFAGYWNRPEESRAAFTADGWLRTGDLGRIDADGYIFVVGRSKELVISGGYNVYPLEVEIALEGVAGVREAAVFGVPDADFGEAVTAAVVPRVGVDLTEQQLIGALKSRLASYKVPKRIHLIEELPRNAMGKVLKNSLREYAVVAGKESILAKKTSTT